LFTKTRVNLFKEYFVKNIHQSENGFASKREIEDALRYFEINLN
jgi:hypothetical protein